MVIVKMSSFHITSHHIPPDTVHLEDTPQHFSVVPAENAQSKSGHATSDKSRLRVILENVIPIVFKTVKDLKDRGRLKKLSNLMDPEEE